MVNTWLREYVGKPGQRSSQEEQVKHQAFLAAVAADPGLASESEEPVLSSASTESAETAAEPLGSPRHLTWLLLLDHKSLTASEQATLAFMREVRDIAITYELAQRFFKMIRGRQTDLLGAWLQECEESGIPNLHTFAELLSWVSTYSRNSPTTTATRICLHWQVLLPLCWSDAGGGSPERFGRAHKSTGEFAIPCFPSSRQGGGI